MSKAIGMLTWESGPDSLSSLEEIPGNIMHPGTFDFPVIKMQVPGANYQTVVASPRPKVAKESARIAGELVKRGAAAIITSCGFNAIYQDDIAAAVDVPVFSSSLMQIPAAMRAIRPDEKIGVITADKNALTPEHFHKTGCDDMSRLCVAGLENATQFQLAREKPTAKIDHRKFIDEIAEVVVALCRENNEITVIVLECTDLPPAADRIRQLTGKAVFDAITMANHIATALGLKR